MLNASFDNHHVLAEQFRAHVRSAEFPCVGAKSALARKQMDFVIARDIASAWDDLRVLPALNEIVRLYRVDKSIFRTLVVLFEGPKDIDEPTFERLLWDRVQSLTDKDGWLGFKPDPTVSTNPDDPHFSLSFSGEAFFVVGIHPGASRPARQFPVPGLVFNLHDQFEVLREEGRYEKMRSTILTRDMALAGDINPMLARHGESSEARQYSGRAVTDDWACPFQRRDTPSHA